MTGSTLRIREFEVCVGGNFPMLPRRKILQQHTKNHVKTQCLSYLSFPENSIFEVIVAIEGELHAGVALLQQIEYAFTPVHTELPGVQGTMSPDLSTREPNA